MATRSLRLAGVRVVDSNVHVLVSCPLDKTLLIKRVTIYNETSARATGRYFVFNRTAGGDFITMAVQVDITSAADLDTWQVLNAGDSLMIASSTTPYQVTVHGAELPLFQA